MTKDNKTLDHISMVKDSIAQCELSKISFIACLSDIMPSDVMLSSISVLNGIEEVFYLLFRDAYLGEHDLLEEYKTIIRDRTNMVFKIVDELIEKKKEAKKGMN